MTLDNNTQQFSDAIRAASERLNIAAIYIEKDYWITKILQQLSRTFCMVDRRHGLLAGHI